MVSLKAFISETAVFHCSIEEYSVQAGRVVRRRRRREEIELHGQNRRHVTQPVYLLMDLESEPHSESILHLD